MSKMKGSYCLIVKVSNDFEESIGSLGKIHFERGYYAYIGSAMNSLEKRIERHLKREKKKHWHIDYLLAKKQAKILSVFIKKSKTKEECSFAKKVAKIAKPIKGFGCSDCKCEAHLFKTSKRKLEELLRKEGFTRWL